MYLPLFAMQAKYIPGCMECIFSIIKDYSDLLQNQLQTDAFEANTSKLDSKAKKQVTYARKFLNQPQDIVKVR